jgi:cbb3-type cytochrome oxidase subunit 3
MKVKKIGDTQNDSQVELNDTSKDEQKFDLAGDKYSVPGNIEKPLDFNTAEKNNSIFSKQHILIGATLVIVIFLLLYYFFVFNNSDKNTTNIATTESLNQNDLKKKELELKEKELKLKERELEQNSTNTITKESSDNNSIPGRFPESSTRYLSSDEIRTLSKYDLKIMRNEIFARHGYIFQTDDMKDYFRSQEWYSPRYADVNSFLTSIEKKNIDLIKYFEKL